MKILKTVEWVARRKGAFAPGFIRAVDQRRLPGELRFLAIKSVEELWRAIKILQIRGAPAIGVAAAFGVVLAAQNSKKSSGPGLVADIVRAADYLVACRPTAVNLCWALERMKKRALAARDAGRHVILERLAREALAIYNADRKICRTIGKNGFKLLQKGKAVLTHCNAGGLAASEYGTALAPIYTAREKGWRMKVFVDETRPLLQGARLTAWELMRAGVEVTLICDNMAALVMKEGKVGSVFVGADRIAANGDTANKIGTYGVALLAKAHKIPFYVFAPTSTFDLSIASGDDIPIEQRSGEEITCGFGKRTAPDGVGVYCPAFDVTPAKLISAIVCEHGICRPPYKQSLRRCACCHPGRDGS